MFSSITLSTLALVAAVTASCNPTTATCSADPAMPSSMTYTLSTTNSKDFTYEMASRITTSGSGLAFAVVEQGDAPTLVTNDYLLYGNVKATIQTAPGVGMVSAFILMSDVLDEIDFEWLGADDTAVQTNYFYRGETASYNRGGTSAVSTPAETQHVYEIDWTESTLRWIIDGATIRTLNKADTAGYGYPSTPCQIKIGVWASGDPSNAAGTIQWGGGPINYAAGPYSMTLTSLSVTSYTSATSFQYTSGGQNFTISNDSSAVAAPAASSTAKTSTADTTAEASSSTTTPGPAVKADASTKPAMTSGSSTHAAVVAASSAPKTEETSAAAAVVVAAGKSSVASFATHATSARPIATSSARASNAALVTQTTSSASHTSHHLLMTAGFIMGSILLITPR